MPKTKFQKFIFGVIMSYAMTFGMEIYNVGIRMGFNLTQGQGFSSMTNTVFLEALKEVWYMGLIVLVVSNLFGNRFGEHFAEKHCDIKRDNPYFIRIMRQAGTNAVMCPTMSLIGTIIFSIIKDGAPVSQLPAMWLGMIIKNFPMAFFWNMFAASNVTIWLFGVIFRPVSGNGMAAPAIKGSFAGGWTVGNRQ